MTMIQAGVATEMPVVKTGQGSMAVDQAADRLKVGHGLTAGLEQPRNHQQCWLLYTPCDWRNILRLNFYTRANCSLYKEFSSTYTIFGMS